MKLGISYMVFDGEELLPFVLKNVRNQVDFVSVVWQKLSYFGNPARPELEPLVHKLKAEGLIDELAHYDPDLSLGAKPNETAVRNVGLDLSIANGCTHHISADVDEFYLSDQITFARQEVEGHDCSLVSLVNYYKKPTYKIVPHQGHTVTFIHPVANRYARNREFPHKIEVSRCHQQCNNCRVFSMDEFVIHHMTFVRKDVNLKLKNGTNGTFCNHRRIAAEFDKYELGGMLRIPPDLKFRRTVLTENLFDIQL